MFINVNGIWKKPSSIFINVAGTWKSITSGFINVAGIWKKFWSGGTLQIQTKVAIRPIANSINSTTKLITLQGTNYYWSPGPPSLTYKFQKSTDNSNWTDIVGASGAAINPAYGSSNTYTYSLTSTNVTKNSLNYYRFIVSATYGSQSNSSTSDSEFFQSPTDITLYEGAITTTTFALSWDTSSGANSYLVYKSSNGTTYSLYSTTIDTSIVATGLSVGTTYYFYVVPITGTTSTNPGYYGNNSNVITNSTVKGAALTPTFGTNTATTDGYTGSVTNYDSSYTWGISTSAGSVTWGTVSGSTRPFTVTGLGVSSPATVTVTTSKTGYNNGSANTTFSSLAGAGLVPTFGTNTSTATGFDGSVTNYNTNWSWSTPDTINGDLTAGYFTWGTASGSTRPFSVTGLSNGASATVRITTTRTGYDPGSATTTGTALLGNARTPTFGPTTPTTDGFTGYVNNYDALWTWSLNGIERGTFTWNSISGSNYYFTVTGLTPGQSSMVGIRSTRTGYTDGLGYVTGSSSQPSYTITYYPNGGGGTTLATSGTLPLFVSVNFFTRPGYIFNSWNTNTSGTGTTYLENAVYNTAANLSLYAIWNKLYTVTWNANGGSVSPSSSQQTSVGGSITAPTPTLSGYTFNGWYSAASGGSLIVSGGGSYTPTSDITLYAQWTINAPSTPTLSHTKAYTNTSVSNNLTRITSSSKRQDWTYTVRVDYNLSWGQVSGATSYEIGVSSTTTAPASATYTGLTGTTMTDYWYQYDRGTVTYYYFVRARNAGGASAWSSASGGTSTATVVTGLGIVLVNATTSATANASPGNTALTYTWTGVATTANHYSYLNATIAGTARSNIRGPSSGSV